MTREEFMFNEAKAILYRYIEAHIDDGRKEESYIETPYRNFNSALSAYARTLQDHAAYIMEEYSNQYKSYGIQDKDRIDLALKLVSECKDDERALRFKMFWGGE